MFLLGILPILAILLVFSVRKHGRAVVLPTGDIFKQVRKGKPPFWSRELVSIMRIVAIALVIIAAARPQIGHGEEKIITEGIDVVICLDVSGSMLAEDFEPNRMTAARSVVKEFVNEMQGNRLALVAFSGKSFTQCPLTTDYHIIEQLLDQIDTETIPLNGTAIGDAIGNSINKFKDEKIKSKVIVLLTDGENNTGMIEPDMAAKIAHDKGIRIYTIGVGTVGGAPVPFYDITGRKHYYRQGNQLLRTRLDEKTLETIASITRGKYYLATDVTTLRQIYEEIAQLEKHKIETKKFTIYNEMYMYFLIPALMLFIIEISLFTGRHRKLI